MKKEVLVKKLGNLFYKTQYHTAYYLTYSWCFDHPLKVRIMRSGLPESCLTLECSGKIYAEDLDIGKHGRPLRLYEMNELLNKNNGWELLFGSDNPHTFYTIEKEKNKKTLTT